MAIVPGLVTIDMLFGSKQYSVDFYQREYKWSDNVPEQSYKPIKSLLDDIFYRFSLCYKESSDINEKVIASYGWYYLNSYMTNTLDGKTYIVDGQQRLTTLTVLAIALYKIGQKLGANEGKRSYIKKHICNYSADGDMVFWMGFSDRDIALKAIFNASPDEKVETPQGASISEKNIYDAYRVIYKTLCEKITTMHMYDAFRLYLFTRVYLINIDVNEPNEVSMVFEVINDRGVPLKAHEILKGKLLGILPKTEVNTYADKWEDIVNRISEHNGKDEDVDYFFGAYFQAKYAESRVQYRELQRDRYHKTIYFDEYDKRIGFKKKPDDEKCTERVKAFVKNELPFFGELYLRLLMDTRKYASSVNEAWLNAINGQDTQCYLLFSAIKLNDPDLDDKYRMVTKEFDRLYTLVNLMGAYKSNDFGGDVIDLGQAIREKSCSEIKAIFNNKAISIIAKAHNRDDITTPYKYELFSNVGYTNLSSRFMRYFFSRVDHFIAKGSGLNTGTYYSHISQESGKDVYHIEHILAHDDNGVNASMFEDDEAFNNQRNRLGDLVLLKGKDNQSSGNELYPEKLDTYVGNGTIFAQTLIPAFAHANTGFQQFCKVNGLLFTPYTSFDGTSIEERQRLLFNIVKLIWA